MLKPLTDRVLLKVGEPEEKTEGGLYIAANKEKPSIAEVIAVGPGKKDDDGKLIPMVVKKGDKVVGVKAHNNVTGKEYILKAKAIIMGCGGFASNNEMLTELLDEQFAGPRKVTNTGTLKFEKVE